jgi:hypothetical protein
MPVNENSLANLKPFVKGDERINRGGRPRTSITARWRALNEEIDPDDTAEVKRTRIDRLYDAMYAEALKGNVHAAALIANRADGKPHQSVTISLDQREKFERMVDKLVADEAAEGRSITRDEAIAALAVTEPLVSELLN